MSDIFGNERNINDLRADRSTRGERPEFPPGQKDDDLFSNSFSSSTSSTGPTDFNSVFQRPLDTSGFGGMPGFNQPQEPAKNETSEDKIFRILGEVFKSILDSFKDIINSFKLSDADIWASWSSLCVKVSGVSLVVGVLLHFLQVEPFSFNMIIASLTNEVICIPALLILYDKAKECRRLKYEKESNLNESSQQTFNTSSFVSESEWNNSSSESLSEDYDDDDFFSGIGDEDEDFFSSGGTPVAGMSTEDALESMQDISKGMYTRQYLYETFTKVLDTITPDFSRVKTYTDDDDDFLGWECDLRDAAEISGIKDGDLPDLLEMEETLTTIKLVSTRPQNARVDKIAEELGIMYAHSDGDFNDKIYAIGSAVGKKCIFTVFKGANPLVSLKDMYGECKDFILDVKNFMPAALGIDEKGNVIKADFKDIVSCIIAGMPRSGKSWEVKLILAQLVAFLPPSELHIYILDPKDKTSDYSDISVPHIKKFISKDDAVLRTLDNVINVEGSRRASLIGDAGCKNIWDYKKKYPTAEMPVILVLIDEVVTFSSRMDKDTKSQFQKYLVEIITRLPSYGIHLMLVPHVLKNDILAKTATDTIACKISVCGDAEHVETTTGAKPRDFSYSLVNKGDMAVKMPHVSAKVMYTKAGVLADTNDKMSSIFDFLRQMWVKLEPESIGVAPEIVVSDEETLNRLCKSRGLSPQDYLGIDDFEDDLDIF